MHSWLESGAWHRTGSNSRWVNLKAFQDREYEQSWSRRGYDRASCPAINERSLKISQLSGIVAVLEIDFAKRAFALLEVDASWKPVLRKAGFQSEPVRIVARLPPCLIGTEPVRAHTTGHGEAITRYEVSEIFNSNQCSQFASAEFTGLLEHPGIQMSINGRGAWRDKVFVERLWKAVNYENV